MKEACEPPRPKGRGLTLLFDKDFNYISLRYFNVAGSSSNLEFGKTMSGYTDLITVAVKAALNNEEIPYFWD